MKGLNVETRPSFRRLLLGVRLGRPHPTAFRIAADFARALGLEMQAVLVEDSSLAIASRLPMARELRLPTHEWQSADPERLARELQFALEDVRRNLGRESAAAGIDCRLEIRPGDPSTALFALGGLEDIVAVIDPAEPTDFITGTSKRMHDAAMASAATILLVPSQPAASSGPVLVAADNSDHRSVFVAGRLAVAASRPLVLLAVGDGVPHASRLRDTALASGLGSGSIQLSPLRGLSPQDLLAVPGMRSGYCLVGTKGLVDLNTKANQSLSSVLGIPVLMLGPGGANGR